MEQGEARKTSFQDYAKALWHFQLKSSCTSHVQEYERAAHALRKLQGPRAVFLRCYATYLLGEARKEEERLEAGGLLGSSQAINKVPSQRDAKAGHRKQKAL